MTSTLPISSPATSTIRPTSVSDLGAITGITFAALLSGLQQPNCFTHVSLCPVDQYHHRHLIIANNKAIATTGVHMVAVAEMPSDEDCNVRQVVTVSVWRIPVTHVRREDCYHIQSRPPALFFARRDTNSSHLACRVGAPLWRQEGARCSIPSTGTTASPSSTSPRIRIGSDEVPRSCCVSGL